MKKITLKGQVGCSCPSSFIGLQPVNQWKVYEHEDLPGNLSYCDFDSFGIFTYPRTDPVKFCGSCVVLLSKKDILLNVL